MKRAKKRQAKYADKGSKPVDFQVGDPVYYKRHQRRRKLEGKWQPYYLVVEKTSPVTYVIRNQLDGVAVKVLPVFRYARPRNINQRQTFLDNMSQSHLVVS